MTDDRTGPDRGDDASTSHQAIVLQAVADAVPYRLWWEDAEGRLQGCSRSLATLVGANEPTELIGRYLADVPGAAELLFGSLAEEVAFTDIDCGGTRFGVVGVVPPEQPAKVESLATVGRVAIGIANEVNTPLQFASDNVAFLLEGFDELLTAVNELSAIDRRREDVSTSVDLDFLREEIPDALAQTREGLDQVAQLIRGLRDFAAEGGDHVRLDLNEVVNRAVLVAGGGWKYAAELDLFLDPDLPPVLGSQAQLKQAVVALLVYVADTLADAAESGELGIVTVSTAARPRAVRLAIADNGPGLTAERRDALLTGTDDEESGLALRSVANIVASHGGTIEVDSALGSGTTFYIDFPVLDTEASKTDRQGARQ